MRTGVPVMAYRALLTSAPPSFSAEDLPMAEFVSTTDVEEHILRRHTNVVRARE